MINLLVLDSELELIPEGLWLHPQVQAYAQRFEREPGELLLDSSFCHAAMKDLPEADRRGRPDIIHQLLLTAFDSPIGAAKKLQAFVHTRGDRLFHIPPGTRIPRNYYRFCGLFAKLLRGEENPIIKEIDSKQIILHEPVYVLDPEGEFRHGKFWHGREGTFVIGGFPHGTYRTQLPAKKYSLAPQELTAPAAAALLLSWIYEGLRL